MCFETNVLSLLIYQEAICVKMNIKDTIHTLQALET